VPIIKEKIKPDSIVYTDSFVSYDMLDASRFRHERINHSQLFAGEDNYIKARESFWSQVEGYLRHFKDIPKDYFTSISRGVNGGSIIALLKTSSKVLNKGAL